MHGYGFLGKGQRLTMSTTRTCTRCGALLAGGLRFCETCGQPVEIVASIDPPKPLGQTVAFAAPTAAAPTTVIEVAKAARLISPKSAAALTPIRSSQPALVIPTTGGAWGALALTLGGLSVLAWFMSPLCVSLFALGGLVCGFLGRRSPQRILAIIGAVMSLLGLAVYSLLLFDL